MSQRPRPKPEPSAYASWDASVALSQPWLEATHLGQIVRLEPGAVVFREGDRHDAFYLLRSGFIHSVVQRSNGDELLLEVFGPGALFGEGPAFSELPRPTTAKVVAPAVLSRYRPREVAAHFAARPELADTLIRLLGFKNHMIVDKLARATSTSPQERVAALLARIARWYAGSGEGTTHSRIDLTHEQIAAMTALSRVTVTRTLRRLAAEGLVQTRPRQIVVLDMPALQRRLVENRWLPVSPDTDPPA